MKKFALIGLALMTTATLVAFTAGCGSTVSYPTGSAPATDS